MNNNLILFTIFMLIVVSVAAVSFAYRDSGGGFAVACACMSNECNLTGFALDIQSNYCNNSIPLSSTKPLFSYTVVPNVTCSVARDCFYDSSLFGCKDMYDYDNRISGWCCYDNCKLFRYKHVDDVS